MVKSGGIDIVLAGLRDNTIRFPLAGSGLSAQPYRARAAERGTRYRRPRKNAVISAASKLGCSIAAKCPPFAIGVQR